MSVSRQVLKKVFAIETPEGVGAKVRRSIGTASLRNLSPFLMLDHFTIGKGAGFPDHPHRGQATLTYVLKGTTAHEDSKGHKGEITTGGIQLMTAGRGVIHAEMPVWPTPDAPDPVGLQLWIDIPKASKMMEPDYQEYSSDKLPVAKPFEGANIKVISGKSYGIESPVKPQGGCWYFHGSFENKSVPAIFQEIPLGWTAFLYTLQGSLFVGDNAAPYEAFHTLVLTSDESQTGVKISPASDDAAFILVAGQPLDQPVVQHGPFVLTSREEIIQTIQDYQNARNGFEEVHTWQSEIGNRSPLSRR